MNPFKTHYSIASFMGAALARSAQNQTIRNLAKTRRADGNKLTLRQIRERQNRENAAKNRRQRDRKRPPKSKEERLIAGMTNWQRNQWVRDGGKRSRVAHFAKLPHWKRARKAA